MRWSKSDGYPAMRRRLRGTHGCRFLARLVVILLLCQGSFFFMRCTSHAHFVMREHRGLSRLSLVTMLGGRRKIQFTVFQPSERCQLFCSTQYRLSRRLVAAARCAAAVRSAPPLKALLSEARQSTLYHRMILKTILRGV